MCIALSVYKSSTSTEPQILCFSWRWFPLYAWDLIPESFGIKAYTVPSGKPVLFIVRTVSNIIAFISMK